MTSLISDELNKLLCKQLINEKYNANLYLFIAGFLRNKGLDNLAKIFIEQNKEEESHSKMFFDILTDMNSDVDISLIPACNVQINTILDISRIYLEREIMTTNEINTIKKFSIQDNNPVVEEFCRKMISLQQKEYEEATNFQDKAILTGGDWKFIFLWDQGLG